MRVRLGKELHTTSLVEFLQLLKHLRGMDFELLDAYARERESHLEEAVVLLYHFVESVESRHVRALSDVGD